MLLGMGVLCRNSAVYYLDVSFVVLITLVGEEKAIVFCYQLLFIGISSSSGCSGLRYYTPGIRNI